MNIDFDRLKYSLTGEYEEVMLEKQLEEKDKEIERLNNIINELEKWLEQEYEIVKANSVVEPNNCEWYIKWNERKNVLDKIKELKGSDKE